VTLRLFTLFLCVIGFQQISFAGGQLAGLGAIGEAVLLLFAFLISLILFVVFQYLRNKTKNKVYSIFIYFTLIAITCILIIPLYLIIDEVTGRGSVPIKSEHVTWIISLGILVFLGIRAMVQTYKKDR